MLYEELAKYSMLVDAVVAPVVKAHTEKLVRDDRGFTGVFAHDGWIVPLTECAIAKSMCIVIFLRTIVEWYDLEESGLARYVDLFVFEDHALYNKLNRNLNHVVVEDIHVDAPVLVATLQNITQHHKYRRPAISKIRKARATTLDSIKNIVKTAYNEKPSFTEVNYFLDAMHSDNERQRLILNLRTLLSRGASVREIRGLADPPRPVKGVGDGA
jgi:hypothetical protein